MTSNEIIEQLDKFQVRLFRREDGTVVPADPVTLAENLLLIRGLLIQLVDKVADAELDYRKSPRQPDLIVFIKAGDETLPCYGPARL
jgi:hypothetical protein